MDVLTDQTVGNARNSFDIAIVGMAGRFPGAPDLETFWRNVRDGNETIVHFSDNELLAAGIPATVLKDQRYVKAWGVLEDIGLFDAAFFGFSPREAKITDPQHRFFLECAWEALEAAGYGAREYRGSVAIYAGASLNTYLLNNLAPDGDLLRSEIGLSLMIGNEKDHLTTRVSYKLGLTGPSINLQTSCSTSLVAVHMGCQSLWAGECDLALAGGVTIRIPQNAGYWHREGDILSGSGSCRPFDAESDGTVWGSGVGVVVLKRLSDAIRCRDHIHAVIKGTAINNDGAGKIGYTAPSIDGQSRVITQALAAAAIPPETVGYIEAHGTGTTLGDPIEVAGLTQAFRAATDKQAFCALGSVKAIIGHLGAAAGIAGLIKTVLALQHKEIPPNIHFLRPNSKIDFSNSPFYMPPARSEWRAEAGPRRAGISSFGVGGTNAHVVLEEYASHTNGSESRSLKVVLLSAKTATALDRATINLVEHLKRHPELDLADVAYTLQVGRESFSYRRIMVCSTSEEVVKNWEIRDPARVLTAGPVTHTSQVAFMFPGGGAQSLNMGRDLYHTEPVFREHLDRCLELLQAHVPRQVRSSLYPIPERMTEASQMLTLPSIALPALFAVEYALAQLWLSWGVRPRAMIGLSLGEYVAACLAGVISLADASALVSLRGTLLEKLPRGAMVSVALPEHKLARLLGNALSIAAINGPSLCVASGAADDIEVLERLLDNEGTQYRRLPIATAAHSVLVEPVLSEFAACVERVELKPPRIPYLSNVTGTWITAEEATSVGYWVRHLRQTVRFTAGLHTLLQEPRRVLLEVGPGQSLSAFARQHPSVTSEHIVLPTLSYASENEPEVASLLTSLSKLWLAGVPVDWSGFSANERRRRVPLPTYPFERERYWIDPRPSVERQPISLDSPTTADELPVLATTFSSPINRQGPTPTACSTAPDQIEHRLGEIWQRVLGTRQIVRESNFFELGGHSLLAVQLFSLCEKTFGRKLPLSTIVRAPTVAQLANVLRRDEDQSFSCIVPLQPLGSRLPFFCIHAESGEVLIYREFAQLLGADQPVFALQAQGLDGKSPPHVTIEEMAKHYLGEIRAVQPSGPYFLGGFCFGAIVSFEIAQQLHASGERVAFLAALDASGPRFKRSLGDYVSFAVQGLSHHPLALTRYLVSTRIVSKPVVMPKAAAAASTYSLPAVASSINEAFRRYDPQPYPGHVTWFVNGERAPLAVSQWAEFAGSVERWVFPGSHATIFQSPAIEILAAQVKTCLERGRSAGLPVI